MDLYNATVPVFDRVLANMQTWIATARDHAKTKGFDESVYLTLRLAPDMLPLPRQIQIASDSAKGAIARLSGQEVPSWADTETTLDELLARLQKTRDFVTAAKPDQINGSETREVSVPRRDKEPLTFKGEDFLRFFATPNLYFHATTLYALLRHAGVPLGKMDFLGR
ncbi:DUF1993 domain-containing protein [Roseateles amylovorans]|uniref:DUF1993 domain-containing protein n=1 Tax=Roseateles amylovorans TaxID=2978473 RepID=A0ABY6B0L0_9BURK|nr:DUF1993 domain-containing protein [Roseateles amylovorans]UXH76865.1 DUF1993 domain-containing protein [Roseateles amylovorans]